MTRARIAIAAFIRRDFRIALSYRAPYVTDLFAILVTVVLFFYVSKLVDPGASDSRDLDEGYFSFVLIGISVFGIAQVGLTSFAEGVREEQVTGTLETVFTTPVTPAVVVMGMGVYDLARGFAAGILTLVAGVAVFGADLVLELGPLLAAALSLASATVMFAALGILVAAFTVLFKQARGIVAMIGILISLLSGVYYPVELLPGALEAVASVVPITWALDMMRDCLIHGEVDGARMAGLLAASLVAIPLSLRVFSASIRRARVLGTLGHY